jgi:thioredoxin-related protein
MAIMVALVLISKTVLADINWENYENAFIKAKKEKKLVMIYIYSPECHYCKEMEETTFKDKQVQQTVNRYFVPVKVRKCSKDGQEIRKEYGYLGTPTFHFIEPNGKKIKSIFGAWIKEDFLKILKYFYEKHYKTKSMTDYFMEN